MIRLASEFPPIPPPSESEQVAPLQVSIEDWDLLFRAVLARLTVAVNRSADHALQDRVSECAQALEQLRVSMVEDFARRAISTGSTGATGSAGG
jgi:hypothetical protein